jgi:T5SS/PEP-CTERM-associated repeat protein
MNNEMGHIQLAGVIAAGMLSASALAVDKVWVDNGNQAWTSSFNWNPSGMPSTADTAIFNLGNVTPPYFVLFLTPQFQAINAVTDKLRIDSNPITFTVGSSTLTIDSTDTAEAGRGLVIGRNGSGVPDAVLENLLSQLNTVYGTLGADAGSTGTLNVNGGTFNVTGTGATWDLIIGRNGGGTITVNNGSDVTAAGDTMLGLNAGSTGAVTIDGAGSTWTQTGLLAIGDNGSGSFVISGDADSDANEVRVGNGAGSGQATVTGAGSIWTPASLWVGHTGEGTLTVSNGAQVLGSDIHVGYAGEGSLTTASGAQIQSSDAHVAGNGLYPASVTVTDPGSLWNLSNNLQMGEWIFAEATLNVANGGKVSDAKGYMAYVADSLATVNVNGSGSEWSNSDVLAVGYRGTGVLEVTNGGQVTSTWCTVGALQNSQFQAPDRSCIQPV